MNKSEEIDKLATALSKFQGEEINIPKNGCVKYGNTEFRHAKLADILAVIRPLLSKHGLAISQDCQIKESNVEITTTRMHESGQYMSSTLLMPIMKGSNPMQAIGAAITYGRRYAICAPLGIESEDDTDGNVDNSHSNADEDNRLDLLRDLIRKYDIPKEVWEGWQIHFSIRNFNELSLCDLNKLIAKIEKTYGGSDGKE